MIQIQVVVEINEATGFTSLQINQLAREDVNAAEREWAGAIETLIQSVVESAAQEVDPKVVITYRPVAGSTTTRLTE